MAREQPRGASIVIPTTMRRDSVAPVVDAALAAVDPMPGGEVIVVANGPAGGRRSLELRSPALRVIECEIPRTAAARNLGLREAANDLVIFTDDDCLVSPEWVATVATRLHDQPAVATPLKMRLDGPVTTFLDYQRIFDPRPIDAETVHFGIGASIGVRRDLIPALFDEDLKAGDDVQFGDRLRDAGIPTAYEDDAPAPLHLVPERLESVTERFFRYGASNAVVHFGKNRMQSAIPYAPKTYASLCSMQMTTPRRFEEISDPALRGAFATLDLCVVGCVLSGYLDAAGRLLGRALIRFDGDAFDAGWLEIERRLEEELSWEGDWHDLPVDFGPWLTPRQTSRPELAGAIAEHLKRTAALTAGAENHPDIDRGGDQVRRQADEVWTSVNGIWGEVREGAVAVDVDAIARRMRADGVSFREGMQTMETIAFGAVGPASPSDRGDERPPR